MKTSSTGTQTPEPVSTGPDPGSRTHDAVAAGIGVVALGLLFGAPWLVDTAGPDPFYKGPLIFPLITLGLTVLGALPAAVRLAASRSGTGWFVDGRGIPFRAIAVFVLMCFFPAAIGLAGLGISIFVFVLVGLLVSGYRNPVKAVAIAAIVAVCLHLAFITFLDIWFPAPALVEWFEGG